MTFLTELMGTRYIINALSDKLNTALTGLSDGETVDVCRAKFGPGAYTIVTQHMKRLNFINSADDKLNKILKVKQSEIRGKYESNLPVPEVSNWEEIVDYVYSLPQDLRYYKWDVSVSRDATVAIIAVCLVHVNKVIDLSNRYIDVFSVLKLLGCPSSKKMVYVGFSNPNYVQYEIPNDNYLAIPSEFGMTAPIDLRNPDPNHPFYNVVLNMQNLYKEEEYESFVEAANRILL